jgi:hypothetical protein
MMASQFNSSAYSVRLFMPHGDPDGLRIIDQPNWSGVGVAFPRGAYKEVSKRKEFERTGIYILFGPGPDGSAMPSLYIGQSDRVHTRLDSHHKNKDFWEWAVFFVSKDNALNVAAAQYIESQAPLIKEKTVDPLKLKMTTETLPRIRYTTTDLAEKIANTKGARARTIQVQMVGNVEGSSLLKELRVARKPAKNSTFRVK